MHAEVGTHHRYTFKAISILKTLCKALSNVLFSQMYTMILVRQFFHKFPFLSC